MKRNLNEPYIRLEEQRKLLDHLKKKLEYHANKNKSYKLREEQIEYLNNLFFKAERGSLDAIDHLKDVLTDKGRLIRNMDLPKEVKDSIDALKFARGLNVTWPLVIGTTTMGALNWDINRNFKGLPYPGTTFVHDMIYALKSILVASSIGIAINEIHKYKMLKNVQKAIAKTEDPKIRNLKKSCNLFFIDKNGDLIGTNYRGGLFRKTRVKLK